MSDSHTMFFPNIDPKLFQLLHNEAVAAGAQVFGDVGKDERFILDGCTLLVNYNADSNVATVNVLDKPWYASCGEISSKLESLLQKAKQLGETK